MHALEQRPSQGNVTVYQGKAGDWVASRYGLIGKGRTKQAAKKKLDTAVAAASWYCGKCHCEVYQHRCRICGKRKQDKA